MHSTVAAFLLAASLGQSLNDISTRQVDVVYGRKHGTALTMDVVTPKENANGIGVIWVAAGGWYSAHSIVEPGPTGNSPIEPLVKRGYTVFGVVMGSQPKFTIPELVEDLNRASRYIHYHAADYKIDPNRIGVTGGSAGGHLSLMLATAGTPGDPKAKDPVDRASSRVQAAAVFFPPTDFLNYGKEGENAVGRGTLKGFRAPFDFHKLMTPAGVDGSPTFERITDEQEILTIARTISPITHVTNDDPPALIIHGDADKLVPIQQAEIFAKKMHDEGAIAEIVVRPGQAHGWKDIGKDWDVLGDWFDKHLKSKPVAGSVTTAVPKSLPRATPESQGVSSAALRAFIETADQKVNTMHSVIVVRHGQVVLEAYWAPEAADKPHVMHSLSKSFCSTAVGLAIAEGKLSLDDPVLKFFPDDAPEKPSDNMKKMRVRDLLTMSTGQQTQAKHDKEHNWVREFLRHETPHKPGTHFFYNSVGTYMCSAIVQKVTGQTVRDYLTPRLFEPLGIDKPNWEQSPQGIDCGGWGLFIKTEDIAKFGQLYLQKGMWNGHQLVPAGWIEQATARQVSNGSDPEKDWDQGYGFQFWRCRHGAYRGDGANGQFCIVLPEQDAVIAITSDTKDMQAELNVVWDKLLPAFQSSPLGENAAEQAKLKELISGLKAKEKPLEEKK